MLQLVALTALLFGQLAGSPPPAPASDLARNLEAMAKEALARVERMRGQKLSRPLKMGVKSKPQVTAFIQQRLKDEYGPVKVAAEGDLLKLQGLLPPELDYGGFITQLLTEQVAGFYDHTRQELHIADWLPLMVQEPVMAHEIFHAIQDQEWGGGKLIDSKRYTHDAVLAHAALMEGDATIVMLNYGPAQFDPEADLSTSAMTINLMAASLPMQMASPEYPVMAVAPDYLKQSLIFPYQQGLLFVARLRQAGYSWAQIRKVYADPPQSTEQILHPKRYIERDVPSTVDLKAALPGWEKPWTGTLGEFHWRQVLLRGLDQVAAAPGAEGWDGDDAFLARKGEEVVFAALTTWDDEAEAKAFEEALRAAYAKAPLPTGAGSLRFERRGTELAVVASRTPALLAPTLAAVWTHGKVQRR